MPQARTHRKTSVLLAESIAAGIASDGLLPGDRLPVEAEMLTRYEVGRASLREALRILEAQGVIEIRVGARGGPFVAQPQPQKVARVLSLMLRLSGVSFSEVMAARTVLQRALAHEAAVNRTPEQLNVLQDNQRLLERLERGSPEFMAANRGFHTLLAEASQNRVLALQWSTLSTIADGTEVGIQYGPANLTALLAAHRKILGAIEAQDGPAAEAAMVTHLNAASDYVRRHYRHLYERPITVVSSL